MLERFQGGCLVRIVAVTRWAIGREVKYDNGCFVLGSAGEPGDAFKLIIHPASHEAAAAAAAPAVPLALPPSSRCSFQLTKPDGSVVYLSADGGADANAWLASSGCGAGETLTVDGDDPNGFLAFAAPSGGGFMSPAHNTDAAVPLSKRRAAPAGGWERWRLVLAGIPTIDVRPLVLLGVEALARVPTAGGAATLPAPARAAVARIAQACEDIGFFQVVGHGVPMTLLDECKLHTQELAPSAARGAHTNVRLVTAMCAKGTAFPAFRFCADEAATTTAYPTGESGELALEFTRRAWDLTRVLLHAMALGQTTGDAEAWRWIALPQPAPTAAAGPVGGGGGAHGGAGAAAVPAPAAGAVYPVGAVTALRVLQYPPAPAGTIGIRAHRDATWITVLAQDDVGGLHVAKHPGRPADPAPAAPAAPAAGPAVVAAPAACAPAAAGGAAGARGGAGAAAAPAPAHAPAPRSFEAVPVPGALLINTGMALQEFSHGAFRATCHWVAAKPGWHTRVSMPFFYDAIDKNRTTSCGGATGCHHY